VGISNQKHYELHWNLWSRYCAVFYEFRKGGSPRIIGSGTYVSCEDKLYVLTAGHVLEHIRDITSSTSLTRVQEIRWAVVPAGESGLDITASLRSKCPFMCIYPSCDIGVLFVSKEGADEENFFSLSKSTYTLNELAGIFLATGVPSNSPTKVYSPYGHGLLNPHPPRFMILPRDEVNKTISLDNRDRITNHLKLQFKYLDGEEFPLLGGFSGSGLWYLEPEEPHIPYLISVVLQALEDIVLVYLPDKLFIPKN
jgi:hypothetical protein